MEQKMKEFLEKAQKSAQAIADNVEKVIVGKGNTVELAVIAS